MEEATHFTDEESAQGTHGQAETRTEVFRFPATGTPLCVCVCVQANGVLAALTCCSK